MSLKGRVAVVTGAAGGIGSAIARSLAAAGSHVCLSDLKAAEETSNELSAFGVRVIDVPTDIKSAGSVKALFSQVADIFGHVDILVNAAGVVSFGAAATLEETEWDRVIDTNLKGVFLCCQAVIPLMRRQRAGRIINIGSIIGKNGGNARPWIDPAEQKKSSNIAYGASKAGVHAMTLFLARELARDGITVNAVAPGPVSSAMTKTFPDTLKALIPLGRMGTADEVAAAVTFLAGDTAGFITGEILDVNGGMWLD